MKCISTKKNKKREVIFKVTMLNLTSIVKKKEINTVMYKYSLYRSLRSTIKFKDLAEDRKSNKKNCSLLFKVLRKF